MLFRDNLEVHCEDDLEPHCTVKIVMVSHLFVRIINKSFRLLRLAKIIERIKNCKNRVSGRADGEKDDHFKERSKK
jgi:hypothetical protein